MYDREYSGKTLNFEASGGLINSSLVMQDFETDSYWAIMSGESIAGEFKGTQLVELPVGKKMQWRKWKAEHPETLVLSVAGQEDGQNPYGSYFNSDEGFRGSKAKDARLKTKEPIFAFHLAGKNYAVPHSAIESGQVFSVGQSQVFLYRPKGSQMFYSTLAYKTAKIEFKQTNGQWVHTESKCVFDVKAESFSGDALTCPQRLEGGFDTFWYNWSLNNPETEILKPSRKK